MKHFTVRRGSAVDRAIDAATASVYRAMASGSTWARNRGANV